MTLFNKTSEKSKRQQFRRALTPAEALLWAELRGRAIGGWKFRRQYGIGPYVVDFYCPSAHLAIEVDGDSHFQVGAEGFDRRRQLFIESFGIRVLRVTNPEVIDDLEGTVSRISMALGEPPIVPLREGDGDTREH